MAAQRHDHFEAALDRLAAMAASSLADPRPGDRLAATLAHLESGVFFSDRLRQIEDAGENGQAIEFRMAA